MFFYFLFWSQFFCPCLHLFLIIIFVAKHQSSPFFFFTRSFFIRTITFATDSNLQVRQSQINWLGIAIFIRQRLREDFQ